MSHFARHCWVDRIRLTDGKLAGVAIRASGGLPASWPSPPERADLSEADFNHNRLGAEIEEKGLRIHILTDANSTR